MSLYFTAMFPCARSVSSALQLQHESRVTELSFRGYDVVAVSAYIAGERDPEPSVSQKGWILRERKGDERERGREGRSRGWVYPQSSVSGQIKHEAARSFRPAWSVSFTGDPADRELSRACVLPRTVCSAAAVYLVRLILYHDQNEYIPQSRKY